MNECNSIEEIDRTGLCEQTKFQLGQISKTENYSYEEINQGKSCSKILCKYIATFDYIDKILIVLSGTTGAVSIWLFTSVAGAPVGITSASFTLFFSLTTGIVKKIIKHNKKQKKKLKIFTLAKSKLSSIESLISQALIDIETSHQEYIANLKDEEKIFEKMKENLRSENEKQEIMRLSSVKSKT